MTEESLSWYWWAGFTGDVQEDALYALGEFTTREEAIAAGRAKMPDVDGNTFFHIVEAQFGELDPDLPDFQPFAATRGHEIIETEEPPMK